MDDKPVEYVLKKRRHHELRLEELDKRESKRLGLTSLIKILKKFFQVKYRKIKPVDRFTQTNQFFYQKFIFLRIFLRAISEDFLIVFIDESSFNTYYDKRYMWSKDSIEFKN